MNYRYVILVLLGSLIIGLDIWQFMPENTPKKADSGIIMVDIDLATKGQSEVKFEAQTPVVGIASIALEGTMEDSTAFVQKFTELQADDSVHAIVFKINSGGGSLGTGEILHNELLRLEQVKPVVVIVENDCCSCAYWVASAASYIISPSTASVGSIGTLEVIKKKNTAPGKGDMYVEFIHSGSQKAFRNPDAPALTDEQRANVQQELDFCYDVFCDQVAASRDLDRSAHLTWADGKCFVGDEALRLGLIDAIGYPSDAVAKAEQLAQERFGIVGELDVQPMWYPNAMA